MLKNWTSIQKYLLILGLCLCIVPLLGMLNYVFLIKSLEFENIGKIINRQSQTGALYLSAVHHLSYPYKIALHKEVKPTVVALGSSRVMQFRSSYFNVPFVNLGAAMESLREGQQLFQDMVVHHKPEVVILGLDPWWFSKAGQLYNGGNPKATGEEFQIDMIFLPCEWFFRGKLSVSYYFQVLLGQNPNPFPTIGVLAGTRLQGFYKDGSYYSLKGVVDRRPGSEKSRRFDDVVEEISRGEGAFIYDKSIHPDRWQELVSLVRSIQRENIRLILFLTPLPGQIIDEMQKMADRYVYIDELRRKLPEVAQPYYDFYDPRSFGSNDAEFLDGKHGGEITYLRIIQKIAQDSSSGLAPFLDHPKIAACIEDFQDKSTVPPPFLKQHYIERDYLELGCKKD